MQRALLQVAVPLRVNFLALLGLAKVLIPEEERTPAVYAAAAERFEVDGATLQRLSELPNTGATDSNVHQLYAAVDQYEAAYLAGGEKGVLQAAIASLVHRKFLLVDKHSRKLEAQKLAQGAQAQLRRNPIERAFFDVFAGNAATIESVRPTLDLADLKSKLLRLELALRPDQILRIQLAPIILLTGLVVLGLMRISIGLSRGRPVTFLVLLVIATVGVAVVFLIELPLRTRRGDRALAELRDANAGLRTTVARSVTMLAPQDLALAVGLFGLSAIASGPLADLAVALSPPPSQSSGCGASGCGGGGCGGGCVFGKRDGRKAKSPQSWLAIRRRNSTSPGDTFCSTAGLKG